MNSHFYKEKNNLYSLLNIHITYLLMTLLFLFFFIRMLLIPFSANNIGDKNSLLIMMLSASLFLFAFSFDIIEINLDNKSIQKKKIFSLWKQTMEYKDQTVNFLTIRQSLYGIYVGIDIAIEIQHKRMVLTRFFNTQKIDDFIEKTQFLIEK